MATAYVPGPSLAQAVAELGPLPEQTVRTLFAGIAEALQAIHSVDVIHRDLKPSNVLLAQDGPRVIDFGISRAADATPLTRTGMRIGSPQFMSPEQALGRASSPAIDVFALGSVIFYAATGRTPFGDGPDTAVLFRIAHEDPTLDGCPPALHGLIERCLAKDPAERPKPRELLAELASPPGSPSPEWLPTGVTRRLPAYTAEPLAPAGGLPPDPRPIGPTYPPASPSVPYVPAGSSPGGRRNVMTGLGIGCFGIIAIMVLVTAISGSDDGLGDNAGQPESSSSAEGTMPGTKPIGSRLGRYSEINLTEDYTVSFTDDPKHPKDSTEIEGDLSYDGYSLEGGQMSILPPGQNGTFEACRDNTRYTDALGPEYLVKGKLICVTTESGLIGLVKVRKTGTQPSNYLVFDLTVWQGVPPTPDN
jgi:serine/threonine protein kinase